jgi:aminodeoxyfutalosine deaminase
VHDIPGELGLESGERTINWVERWAPDGTVGFGLGGPELGVPRPQFAGVFDRARALGLASVPHAGESTGPQTVWDAVTVLGAQRIGHGIAAARDRELMAHLAEHRIALEICPTSNVCTRAVASLADHPWRVLRDAGIALTLNSDDPGMFDTSLISEYALAHRVFNVDRTGLADLVRTAVDVSFAPDEVKRRVRAEVDAYTAASTAETGR